MKQAARLLLVGLVVMLAPAVASAGLLDKLNEAAKNMNDAAQQAQQISQQQAQGLGGGHRRGESGRAGQQDDDAHVAGSEESHALHDAIGS